MSVRVASEARYVSQSVKPRNCAQAERCAARSVGSIDVAPEALEGCWRKVLVESFPNDASKELKVIRRADLALHFALNIHPQGRYFRRIFIHNRVQRYNIFLIYANILRKKGQADIPPALITETKFFYKPSKAFNISPAFSSDF